MAKDVARLSDEQRAIVEAHMWLVPIAARRIRAKPLEWEERLSACHLGLCMAALKFDEEVRDFETFAYTVMRHQIIQDIRRKTHTSFGKKTKLQKHQPKDDFWELRADEKTSQSDNRLDAEIVRTRFDRLTKRERMILEAHCAGKHGRDISRNLGMSRGYAHMALKSIVRKLGFAREATPARRRFD